LILLFAFAKLRAMFRLAILLISIIWASLLLISWSGAAPPQEHQDTAVVAPKVS